ncbi:hypothetical protein ACPOL_0317 [Acidisarcina polymorpha]|uniref:Uncharacterized protein n=1 Tax=Acidisarcina polymorpha TaxID=2211140 RepID=A0A2Z5FSC5_9BACT|nr:hypothetical protein ACPOL_0317 [Acidisarcina polymorpha]
MLKEKCKLKAASLGFHFIQLFVRWTFPAVFRMGFVFTNLVDLFHPNNIRLHNTAANFIAVVGAIDIRSQYFSDFFLGDTRVGRVREVSRKVLPGVDYR